MEKRNMIYKNKYKGRIVIETKNHFGKPCVAGSRIPIENVLELVQENIPFEDIINKYYPDLEIGYFFQSLPKGLSV